MTNRTTLIQKEAFLLYVRMVNNLHLSPETRDTMIARLSEDRIASGEVVS